MNFKKASFLIFSLLFSSSLNSVQYINPEEHAQELTSVEKPTETVNFPCTATVKSASAHKKKSVNINREVPLLAGLAVSGGLVWAGKKLLLSQGATVGDYLWYRLSRFEGESYQSWYDGIYLLYKDTQECGITRNRIGWFNTIVACAGIYLCYCAGKKAYEYAYAKCNTDSQEISY
jgi:hypothetical protein